MYPAHILSKNGSIDIQTVEVHLRTCAKYAMEAAIKELKSAAYLAGLLHDMGKYTVMFKNYIEGVLVGEPLRRGSVNHTFAGVRFVMERWYTQGSSTPSNMACEIIATAIGSHHGLFDCIDPGGEDGFLHRISKEGIGYEEARQNFLLLCATADELDRLFLAAQEEIMGTVKSLQAYVKTEGEMRFCLSMLTRMLCSLVIDADRRDTNEFMNGISHRQPPHDLKGMWAERLEEVEHRVFAIPMTTLAIDEARRAIFNQCSFSAKKQNGIYRLATPTGGGKTLAGLRGALTICAEYSKKHTFFVIPLLAVLEQNAKVLRKYVGCDSLILEHHSNIIQEKGDIDKLDENELLLDTWDAPIIITTLVQLLNTLFSGKPSCIRRMHALADSVIVIDEVQSVPRKMLSLFNLAMNFLAAVCHATILLCSATQPYLEGAHHPVVFHEPADIVPYDAAMWALFRRTNIID